jgi:iron complex outermembrane receptor protein
MLKAKATLACLLLQAASLCAQADGPPREEAGLEEIVVSGYRQVSPLELDTSLSVIDGETLQQASTRHFEELVQMVPNMNLSGEGSRARYFQLRGVGELEQYEGAPNPSVGYIIDDIDLSGIGGVSSLYDIGQVEVLRGPQSARYGSSALGGMVYMRSREPTAERSGNAQFVTGNDSLLTLSAAAGGSLAQHLAGRFSVSHLDSDGFRRNAYLGRDDTNGRDELTARGKLRWDFADGWEALLTGLYLDFDNGYDAWTVHNDATVFSDHPGRDSQRTKAGSLRVSGALNDGVDFVSVSSAAHSDILFSYDGDWGNGGFWQQYGDYVYDYRYINPRQRRSLTQEFRLLSSPDGRLFDGSTAWVLGASWQQLREDNDINSSGIYDDSGEERYCTPCLTNRQIDSRYRADTWALFGSIDARVAARLTLSLGWRYEYWDAQYRDHWFDINYPGVPPEGNSCSQFDCTPSDHLWGGHAALSYALGAALHAYARVARGFKAGGFNPSLAALQGVAVLGPEFIPYQPETLWNYELGLRGLWLDGRLGGSLALFTMDRDKAQLSQSSQQVPFDPNSFVFVSYNGQARVSGAEASLAWQLNPTWQLHGALGLLDSTIRDSAKTAAVSPDAIGRDLPHAPNYTLNLGATYNGPTGWFGRLDLNAIDSFYFDISHNQKSRAYRLVNLRLGRQWGPWTLAAWGRNLFDKNYATRGFYFGNEPPWFEDTLYTRFGDPRSYGISLDYDF